MPTTHDIQLAVQRIEPYIWHTPLEYSSPLSNLTGATCWLKMETWQRTGSFKVRGATNRMLQLTAEERTRGVITASAGNHAQGIATCAVKFGIPATIVVAHDTSSAKIAALQRYASEWVTLDIQGKNYDEAEAYAIALSVQKQRTFISPYNDAGVIAGQGTVAVEILEDQPQIDTMLIPVSGGGLAAGMSLWARRIHPEIQLIGVQSVASPAMHAALKAGAIVQVPIESSLADGLAGNIQANSITFPICQRELAGVVLVTEDSIRDAIRWLMTEMHIIVEGAGAVAVAALLSRAWSPSPQSHVALVLSGRNIAQSTLKELL